jgi:thiol-disulfide isomerase/thioredoxin
LIGAGLALAALPSRAAEFAGKLGPFVRRVPPAPAPEIAFKAADGRDLALADFRGRVAVVNFWATWCAPCVEEMPALDRLHASLAPEGIEVVAISVDRGGMRLVGPFFETHGLRALPVYLDQTGASMRAFGVRGLPTTIVVDRQGRDAGRLEGAAEWGLAPRQTPAARTRRYPPLLTAILAVFGAVSGGRGTRMASTPLSNAASTWAGSASKGNAKRRKYVP